MKLKSTSQTGNTSQREIEEIDAKSLLGKESRRETFSY